MPRVSVIIPTYNRAYVVTEAIESILSQTFKDFEILVVDDGSTDDTRNVIEGVGDGRVKYFHKQNGGVSSARNFGIRKAQGQYIAFLDSDDLWPNNFLEALLVKLQENTNYGVAYCATIETDLDGKKIKEQDIKRCVSGHITKELFKNSFVWPMAALIRKNILNDFYFDESLKNSDDNDTFLRLSTKTQFVFVPNVKVVRRCNPDSHARQGSVEGACSRALSLERFYLRLGGDKLVPVKLAKKKMSHVYRRAAQRNKNVQNRKAAICLFKRAIQYYPFDYRLYCGLLSALLISRNADQLPNWEMPPSLSTTITSES